MQPHDDFAFEDSPGIPAPLPPGERVLWQGSPDWRVLAHRPFHVGTVAIWFAALAVFEVVSALSQGLPFAAAVPGVVKCAFLGLSAAGILALLAWLNARVTIYTLTNRRLLIRFGVALQITMNLPFTEIVAANLRLGRRASGDIPLALRDSRRVGYAVLWPHVRPWRFARPEPMLRAVPNAERVAKLLAEAMREEALVEAHGQRAYGPVPHDAPRLGGSVAARDGRAIGGVAAGTP